MSNFCFTILHKNNNPHPIGLPERWLNMAEPFCSLLKIQYPIPSVRIHLWIHLFYFVEATYKWYHIIYSFSIYLIPLNMVISGSIHIAANGIILFFLWPSNIPLCIYGSNVFLKIYASMHVQLYTNIHRTPLLSLPCS